MESAMVYDVGEKGAKEVKKRWSEAGLLIPLPAAIPL
jgi:hypothetical protein